MPLTGLPVELLVQILEDVFDEGYGRPSLANAGKTCRVLHEIAQPILYRELEVPPLPLSLREPSFLPGLNIVHLIATFDANPYLASLVRAVEVHNEYRVEVPQHPVDPGDPRFA